jgi:aldehyde dehydrogenase
MSAQDEVVRTIVAEVLERLRPQLAGVSAAPPPSTPSVGAGLRPARTGVSTARPRVGDGVFATVDEAVQAAAIAQTRLAALSLAERGRIVDIVRRVCDERAEELGAMELAETGIGRLDHKIEKLRVVQNVLGVEALATHARSDASGLTVIEHAPWGVIGMVLPATHSVPTMAGNAVNVLAAGNTAVFCPHPAAARVAAYALGIMNREIERATGIANVMTTVAEPSIEATEQVFHHAGVALLCVTGGPVVVRAAMKAGKRVIAAGPGNPPVVVDESADLDRAAAAVIEGAAYDNNLLCIGEKEVFVVAAVADAFLAALGRAGAHALDGRQIERLTQAAFTFEEGKGKGCGRAHVKKDLIGRDPAVLARAAGASVPAGVPLLFGETPEEHPFVREEQMMPFLPVVRVPDFDHAVAAAQRAEAGYRHTAVIHSRDVDHVTHMARVMDTTLFVQNGPSTAALGVKGAGYLSYSIATPTGEGITTPMTFTRERQIAVAGGALRIH